MDIGALEGELSKAAGFLKVLGNEKRLMVVYVLSKGEKSVGELEHLVGLSQSALSQHLARLRREGILQTRRDAQNIYYKIKCDSVAKLLNCLCDIYTHD